MQGVGVEVKSIPVLLTGTDMCIAQVTGQGLLLQEGVAQKGGLYGLGATALIEEPDSDGW